MNYISAVILGVVEGITEFLPISSTGHMTLAAWMMKIPHSEFLKTFEIAIQLGAILSVLVLYGKKVRFGSDLFKKVLAAFVPTAVIGFIFYKAVKSLLLGNERVVLWALLIGGLLIILFELTYRKKEERIGRPENITYPQAVLIGVFQAVAIVPGVSRAAATIIGGLMLGVRRKEIVEFSFLLAVPTMAAAAALDLMKSAPSFSTGEFGLLAVGFAVSFVTAMAAIKFFLAFIRVSNFIPFGIYRIILALVLWKLI